MSSTVIFGILSFPVARQNMKRTHDISVSQYKVITSKTAT